MNQQEYYLNLLRVLLNVFGIAGPLVAVAILVFIIRFLPYF